MVTEYLGLSDATMLGNLLDSYPSDDNEKVYLFQELKNSGAEFSYRVTSIVVDCSQRDYEKIRILLDWFSN